MSTDTKLEKEKMGSSPDLPGPARQINEQNSVGIVKPYSFTFAEPPNELELDSGAKLGPITIIYETCGKLTPSKDNCIFIMHALSADAHAAGFHHSDDKKPGWWDDMIGPGKPFDTNKYFVLCSNFLGSCKGSTGPASINPKTGKPYGLSFPIITIRDMVKCQKALLDHLGIKKVLAVTGGSIGGMQTLQWTIQYPDMLEAAIPIATTHRMSPQGIAFNEVGRASIMNDPNWNQGEYFDKENKPNTGLAIARMVGHITYLSDESMNIKFGRRLQDKSKLEYTFDTEYQVESYLRYQGSSFTQRFDANTYLYITKVMDYFDLTENYESLTASLARAKCKFLVISFTTDWLFPPYQSREIVKALRANNADVSYCEIESKCGHDAFLLEFETLGKLVTSFLDHTVKRIRGEI